MKYIVLPLLLMAIASYASNGSILSVLIYLLISVCVSLLIRYRMLYLGYTKGVRYIESVQKKQSAFTKACQLAGVFMIGAAVVIFTNGIGIDLTLYNEYQVFSLTDGFNNVLPYVLPLAVTGLVYYLLTKKNWALWHCILLLLAIAIIGTLLGLFTGFFVTPLSLPWLVFS